MNEERHEITYSPTFTERLSRSSINRIAGLDSHGYPGMGARIAACREWLEANPQGMTREEFNKLPDGSVVETRHGTQVVKIGTVGIYTNRDNKVVWVSPCDSDLAAMIVVSTPPPPSLYDVARVVDAMTTVWERFGDDMWERANTADVAVIRTPDLLKRFGPLTLLIPGPQIGGEA